MNTALLVAVYNADQSLLYTSNDPYMATVLASYSKNTQRIADRFVQLDRLMPEMAGEISEIKTQVGSVLGMTDKVVALANKDQDEEAKQILATVDPLVDELRNKMRSRVDTMIAYVGSENDKMTANMQSTIFTFISSLVTLFIVLILAALFVSSRGITGPINTLRARMLTLADGKTDEPITCLGRKDEVGRWPRRSPCSETMQSPICVLSRKLPQTET